MPEEPTEAPFDWTYEATWRRQVRLGLTLTPAERLEWLETTLAELRPLVGRAREAAAAPPQTGRRSISSAKTSKP